MESKNYIGYEYTEIRAGVQHLSMMLDGYMGFGWVPDENRPQGGNVVHLKRDRKIVNRAELTRLQRHFDACMDELASLEKSKHSTATIIAMTAGLVGTVFIAGSVFAVTATPPIIWLTILLAIPGFIGWAVPIFLYKAIYRRQAKKLEPLIEAKYDEIYEIGEKAAKLLNKQ